MIFEYFLPKFIIICNFIENYYFLLKLIFLVHGSEQFTEFMDTIADKIQLKDWKHFKAGLDVRCMIF